MTASAGVGGWRLSIRLPAAALIYFENALEPLCGAIAIGVPGGMGGVPLDAYFVSEPDAGDLSARMTAAARMAGIQTPEFQLDLLPQTDWVAESHKSLPAIRAGQFYIHGSHVTSSGPAGTLPILIDANLAFGTGRHESTRGCLLTLGKLAKRRSFKRVLDMGCGSGILALAAARLWPCHVTAADNDRDAVRMTRKNARINGLAGQITAVLSDGYGSAKIRHGAPYDLITSNILAGPLVAMSADLARTLTPGGKAILSGLLREQETTVLARHRAMGLCLSGRLRLGDWSTLVLAKAPRKQRAAEAEAPPLY